MSRSDLIADVFTLIRNANSSAKEHVDVPASKLIEKIVGVLKKEGYVTNYKSIEDNKQGLIRVYLKYIDRTPVLSDLQRVSKPSLRKYFKHNEIPKVLNGLGISIVSTSKGILTGHECRKMHVGGEILGIVW